MAELQMICLKFRGCQVRETFKLHWFGGSRWVRTGDILTVKFQAGQG